MLIYFRIIDTETTLRSTAVELNARELGALSILLQNTDLFPDLDEGERHGTAYNFEINANMIALATFSRIFAERLDVIALVEEAQWLGRNLRIERDDETGKVTMRVSSTIALSPEFMMNDDMARSALACLGIDLAKARSLRLNTLKDLLLSPGVHQRFENANLSLIFDRLAQYATTDCNDQIPSLTWA